MKLFFDTETTGLPNWKLSPSDPSQPHIVQLAAILTTYDDIDVCALNVLINNNCEIPAQATAVHGISTDHAKKHGISPYCALLMFNEMVLMADEIIGHNLEFDKFMVDIAHCKIGKERSLPNFPTREFCTMKTSTNIVGIPKNHGGGNKYPKLIEAYRFAFQEDFDGAHDAMNDVKAARRLYYWLKGLNEREQLIPVQGMLL